MSPGTGSVLLSQVGIRYVYVQVYRNDARSLWVALKTLHAVLRRPKRTVVLLTQHRIHTIVQRIVNPRHKEDGTDGDLRAYMLRVYVQRETVDPHVQKAQYPVNNVVK